MKNKNWTTPDLFDPISPLVFNMLVSIYKQKDQTFIRNTSEKTKFNINTFHRFVLHYDTTTTNYPANGLPFYY